MENGRYANPARLLHWLMAALILLTIPAGLIMVRPEMGRELQNALFIFHKNAGVLLLLLIVPRLIVRWRHPAPPKPASLPAWQVRVAGLTQGALYVLLVVQPVAGYVRVRAGGFPIEALDGVFSRMWRSVWARCCRKVMRLRRRRRRCTTGRGSRCSHWPRCTSARRFITAS